MVEVNLPKRSRRGAADRGVLVTRCVASHVGPLLGLGHTVEASRVNPAAAMPARSLYKTTGGRKSIDRQMLRDLPSLSLRSTVARLWTYIGKSWVILPSATQHTAWKEIP